MDISSETERLPAAEVATGDDSQLPHHLAPAAPMKGRPHVPYADADPDDLVPGYSHPDAWFE